MQGCPPCSQGSRRSLAPISMSDPSSVLHHWPSRAPPHHKAGHPSPGARTVVTSTTHLLPPPLLRPRLPNSQPVPKNTRPKRHLHRLLGLQGTRGPEPGDSFRGACPRHSPRLSRPGLWERSSPISVKEQAQDTGRTGQQAQVWTQEQTEGVHPILGMICGTCGSFFLCFLLWTFLPLPVCALPCGGNPPAGPCPVHAGVLTTRAGGQAGWRLSLPEGGPHLAQN